MLLFIVALAVLVIDQGSKYVVQQVMAEGSTYPLIQDIFHLTYVRNPGAAFGMMANKTTFFILVSLLVSAGVIYYYRTIPKEQVWLRTSLGMILGGALGNLIDRIRFEKVIDFFDFRVWPVFNVADCAIVVGVGIIIILLLKDEKGLIQLKDDK